MGAHHHYLTCVTILVVDAKYLIGITWFETVQINKTSQ